MEGRKEVIVGTRDTRDAAWEFARELADACTALGLRGNFGVRPVIVYDSDKKRQTTAFEVYMTATVGT